ncbi:hypothetical protein [Rhodococcus gannanensis]|uniref:Secreted protein n=1 Tax=Rhodococcus gannanensis TaxID=1960308 RepID=A0ABW4P2U7_9NOCA
MVRTTTRSGRTAAALAGALGLASAFTLITAPAASAQIPPPEPPSITTTVEGNDVTIDLVDPNRGISHLLTACTAALVNPVKGVNLLPAIAAGTLPPISEIDPAVFEWGPSLLTTNAATRERTYELGEIPSGVYVAVGFCINPNITNPSVDFEPVFVGGTIEVGSAVLDLGSAVVETPGALAAVLDLLGIDTGSLGSAGGSTVGSGEVGSGDATIGSGDATVGSN